MKNEFSNLSQTPHQTTLPAFCSLLSLKDWSPGNLFILFRFYGHERGFSPNMVSPFPYLTEEVVGNNPL
jgi:hypothetical protein